jgi:predicted  nucleic acid-binding Zn-ribbon protein
VHFSCFRPFRIPSDGEKTSVSLKEGLQKLLKVQDVDLELKSLEEAKSKYPAEISRRQAEITRAEDGLKELTDRLEELERRRRHLERELDSAREQLKKLEARFSEVKTNKEYDALQLEVEACKNKMSEYEGEILEIIESGDGIREKVELETQDVGDLQQEQQARIDELQAKLDSLQGEVDGVESQRQAAIKGVDGSLLRSYENTRGGRGLTVAPVRKGSCGACYRQLPAQIKTIVRRSEEIVICESCGAIMAWDDESSKN